MMYEVIGRENCVFCTRAQILLFELDLDFEYKTLDKDVSRETVEEMVGGTFRTVPQIFEIDDAGGRKHIGGFSELVEHLN